jgi:hypothetical protein
MRTTTVKVHLPLGVRLPISGPPEWVRLRLVRPDDYDPTMPSAWRVFDGDVQLGVVMAHPGGHGWVYTHAQGRGWQGSWAMIDALSALLSQLLAEGVWLPERGRTVGNWAEVG